MLEVIISPVFSDPDAVWISPGAIKIPPLPSTKKQFICQVSPESEVCPYSLLSWFMNDFSLVTIFMFSCWSSIFSALWQWYRSDNNQDIFLSSAQYWMKKESMLQLWKKILMFGEYHKEMKNIVEHFPIR